MKNLVLLIILFSQIAFGQNLVGTTVRLKPSSLSISCNTGDIKVDQDDSNRVKLCTANTWAVLASWIDGASGTSLSLTGALSTPLINNTGAIDITPGAGTNLNVNLSTTGDFTVNTSQFYVDTSTANVGIGTTAPSKILEVYKSDTSADLTAGQLSTIRLTNSDTTTNNYSSFEFGSMSSTAVVQANARISGVNTSHTGGAQTGELAIALRNAGSIGEKVRITNTGVGIGTNNPDQKLTIMPGSTTDSVMVHMAARSGASAQLHGYFSLLDGITSPVLLDTYSGVEIASYKPDNSANRDLRFIVGKTTGALEAMRLQGSTGYVGIGTTTPGAKLSVNDGTEGKVNLFGTTSYSNVGFQLLPGTTSDAYTNQITTKYGFVARAITNTSAASSLLKFSTTNNNTVGGATPTDIMVMRADGNIGINAVNPAALLVVGGSQAGNAGFEISPGSSIAMSAYNRTGSVYTTLTFDALGSQFRSTAANGSTALFKAAAATSLNGALTSVALDMATNYTTTNFGVTGLGMTFGAATNTDASTRVYNGVLVTPAALVQNTAAGTNTWNGINITLPDITQTTGTVKSIGFSLTGGTVTSGTTYGLVFGSTVGNSGFGVTAPTGIVHIKAGTATAGTAPLKFTSGTNLTAAEAGAMEWDGTNLFVTATSGPTRKTLAYNPMTTGGDIIYGGSSGVETRLTNGSSGQVLTSGGGTAAPTWSSAGGSYVLTASKTSNYTAAINDLIPTDSSGGAFNVTLLTAVGNTNGKIRIVKTDASTNAVSIVTTSSQTVGGRASADVKLRQLGDYVEVISDNANWIILNKKETQYMQGSGSISYATIGAAGNYGASSGSSVALTYGIWELDGQFLLDMGTGVANSILGNAGFYGADGANSSSAPTALGSEVIAGSALYITDFGGGPITYNNTINPGTNSRWSTNNLTITVSITSNKTIYWVPRIDFSTAGSASIYSVIKAKRIW